MCKKFWWNNLLCCGVFINGYVYGKIFLIFLVGYELEWRLRERKYIFEVVF